MNGRRLIWRIAVAVIVFTLLLSTVPNQANPNTGWEEVGAGSATGGGISNSNYYAWSPSMAIAPDGTPYVAWYNRNGEGVETRYEIYVRRWVGAAWGDVGPTITANQDTHVTLSLTIAPDGTPYVAWEFWVGGDMEIYVRRWNGTVWEEVGTGSASGGGISDNDGWSCNPSLAIAPDGTPYVVWHDNSGQTSNIYVRRWNGSSWEEVGAGSASGDGITDRHINAQTPSITIAPDGTPYVAWRNGSSAIYVKYWDGNSWEEIGGSASGGGINNNDGYAWSPSIAIAPDGTPYVAWLDDGTGGGYEIFVRRWSGSEWEEVGAGSATGGGISNTGVSAFGPSIAVGQDNTPYVAWSDMSNGDWEIYVRRWNGTVWEEVGTGSASGGGISDNDGWSQMPSMAITPDGIAYVAWDDDSSGNDEIYVRRYTGWEPTHRMITGNVADGHGHSLPGVFVGLLRDAGGSYAMTTTTDSNGFYVFNNIPFADTYKVRVILRDGAGRTRILWGQYGLLVNITTQPFGFATGQTAKTVHVHFTDASLESGLIPTDDLDDLAVMFYHTQQVNNFVRNTLGEYGFQPVEGIWAFSPFALREAHYCPIVDPDHCPDVYWVHVHADVSRWDHPNRPMNREWHENFHHLMNVAIPWPKHVGGSYGHRGYENPDTADSWAEGWAEFWPCVLWDTREYLDPHLYRLGNTRIDFERNWKAWEHEGFWIWRLPREEFAVASLLWDLYDPINPADDDFIDLTIGQIWDVIGKQTLENMGDVYDALVAKKIGENNSDGDALSDLEELFVAHGFFVDANNNHFYDPGEKIGYAGDRDRPDRRNTPHVPNAYLLVNVVDKNGDPVSDCVLTVKVEYGPPNDYCNYSYEVELTKATGNMVPLSLPPIDASSTVRITARHPDGYASEVYSTTNAEYWQKVDSSTAGYAEEVTFVVVYRIYLPFIIKESP